MSMVTLTLILPRPAHTALTMLHRAFQATDPGPLMALEDFAAQMIVIGMRVTSAHMAQPPGKV